MSDSPSVTFTGEQRGLLQALVDHWQADARTAEHCAKLCANEQDKVKLTRRQKVFERCAGELRTLLERGSLPPHIAHRQWLEAMKSRASGG